MIFFLYFLKNDLTYHRFAISVSRKIGNSVNRNYIKRKIKEFFRLNQYLIDTEYDLWVVIKKRFGKEDAFKIEQLFVDSFIKINYK